MSSEKDNEKKDLNDEQSNEKVNEIKETEDNSDVTSDTTIENISEAKTEPKTELKTEPKVVVKSVNRSATAISEKKHNLDRTVEGSTHKKKHKSGTKKFTVVCATLFILLVLAVVVLDCVKGELGYTVNYMIGNKTNNKTVETGNTIDASKEQAKEITTNKPETSIEPTTEVSATIEPTATVEATEEPTETVEPTKSSEPTKTLEPTPKPTKEPTKEPTKSAEPTKEPAKGQSNSGKTAYLTFDDGPSSNTVKIIDILNKYNAKATFFVIKHAGCESIYKKLSDNGQTIALHSYSHEYKQIYTSQKAFYNDLDKLIDYLDSMNLKTVNKKILRFPGGSSNAISKHYCKGVMTALTKSTTEKGYNYFDWNVDSTDASGNGIPKAKLVKSVSNEARGVKNIVVLMHDTNAKKTTVDALPEIIENLIDQGYSFKALDENSPVCHHGVNN